MPDLEDYDSRRLLADGVDNPVASRANTIKVAGAGELVGALRPRILRERFDSGDDALAIPLLANRLDFLGGGRFDGKAIPSHAV